MSPSVTLVTVGIDGPGAVGSRLTAFADGLSRRGWTVVIVNLHRPIMSPVDSLMNRLPDQVQRTIERAGIEGDVMPRVGWKAKRVLRDIDTDLAVVSVPPFSLLAAAAMALPETVRLVIDYRDPWSTRRSPPAIARLTRPLERVAVKRAAGVSFAGAASLKGHLADQLRLPPNAVVSVPNGHNPSDLASLLPPPQAETANDAPLDLVFVGYWYGRNGPASLPDALRDAGPEIATLTVVGDISPPIRLKLADIHITQVGPLSRSDAYRRLVTADAAVIALDSSSAVESRIPAKIYDYLAVGVPVITMCPANAALLQLPGADRFHHFEPDNAVALATFLRQAADNRSLLRRGPRGVGTTRNEGVNALHQLLKKSRIAGRNMEDDVRAKLPRTIPADSTPERRGHES